jgi:hypothetical protein
MLKIWLCIQQAIQIDLTKDLFEKAQLKFAEGNSHYTRFKNIIEAMYISKSLISDEISKRD